MAKRPDFIPQKLRVWIEARKRPRLSHADIQMARELGLNPEQLGKIDNHRQEPWKAPLPVFIETLYSKRFGKDRPDEIKTIEQIVEAQAAKKRARKLRKEQRRNAAKLSAAKFAEAVPESWDLEADRDAPF
jgi:hypothetical protein